MPDDQNGNESDNSNDNDDESKFVTQEDLAKTVNAAVSNHTKRLETKLTTSFQTALTEGLKDLIPKPADDDDNNVDDDPPKGNKPDPKMTAMERQVAKLTTQLKTAEDARATEADQRKQDSLRTAVLKQLGEAGLSGQHLRAAQAVLYQESKVHVDDNDKHLFRDADGVDLPLADGIKTWASSDEAKLFLPPRDVRGSGDRGNEERTKLPKIGKDDKLNAAYADAVKGTAKHVLNIE